MKLLGFPNELLLLIITSVEDNLDLFSLLQAYPQLKALILPHLYDLVSKSHPDDEIHYFAKHGMLACVEYSLSKGLDVDVTDSVDERTALSMAAGFGHPTLVEYLLDHGADIHDRACDGLTPLHYAAFEGHTDTVQLLIARGADPDLMALDKLFERVGTPLSEAARGGHPDVVRILLDNGADISTVDDSAMTPLLYAARAGTGIPLRHSMRRRPSESQSFTDPAFLQSGPGPGKCLDWVIDRDRPGEKLNVETRFECSVPRNYLDTVKLLIERGADCNRMTSAGQGVLKCIRSVPLVAAAWGGDVDIVKFIIDSGADVNSSGSRPFATPLHAAAWHGSLEALKSLIDAGADVNSNDRTPYHTVLHAALERWPYRSPIVKFLWAAGARLGDFGESGSDFSDFSDFSDVSI